MKKNWLFGSIGGFINGFFGTGGGTVVLFSMQKTMADKKKANATCLFVMVPVSLISVGIYLWNNAVDWQLCLQVAFSGAVGGAVGAYVLNKIKYRYILWLYCFISIVGGIGMIVKR